ncbi:MAG TPA: sigma 54-interacting transcriptional regulator [Kofleriaceae bacterium]|nr:sigma 54-interacting transcriptional regulator [Kofleriaceae bacterium]
MAPRFVDSTLKQRDAPGGRLRPDPLLVLAYHPMLARVGETMELSRVTELSRLAPSLMTASGDDAGPLDDPFVSRQPIRLVRRDDGAIDVVNSAVKLIVDGAVVRAGATQRIAAHDIARGVPIVVADRVVLWLTMACDPHDADELGMFGTSEAMHTLRDAIRAEAGARGPVLVHGETGSGKELVARALHAIGPRAQGPYVGVNVAAIPAAVAVSELFGHERGAFTGATERRAGYFERAHRGVLFLDEIGELPEAVQPMLLRALESGEIQPIGGAPRTVDVAVVAATDADLAAAVRAGRFRRPLYYRLAAAEITVPSLRARGADVAILLARFLLDALPAELADGTTAPTLWLPAPLVAALMRAPWPGNVRQLRSAAHRLAQLARAGRTATLDTLEALGIDDVDEVAGARDAHEAPRDGAPIDDERLIAALRAHRFQLARTAAALGISRTHLDALIARSGRVRKAKQLARDEIAACIAELGDDLDAIAARLEVSPRGLRLRMNQLDL